MVIVTVLIQADSMAFQAAYAYSVVTATLDTPVPGGLLQSPVPTRGDVYCTAATTMSTEAATVETTAFLLVASGIKNINYEIFSYFFVMCLYSVFDSSS